LHKTACKPASPDNLTDDLGEHLKGHQNYTSKVAMETLVTEGNSLTDVCLVVKM